MVLNRPMSHPTPQSSTVASAKHPKVPRSNVIRLREVLAVVNGDAQPPGRILAARNRITEALSRLLDSCDAIERAPATADADDRDFTRLSAALEPLRGRLAKVRLFPAGTVGGTAPSGTGRDRSHRFRVTEDLMRGQDAEDELYLAFAHEISRLDDLRRIRRCDRCDRFYVRTKVQRQVRHFCSDDCRRAFHNGR